MVGASYLFVQTEYAPFEFAHPLSLELPAQRKIAFALPEWSEGRTAAASHPSLIPAAQAA